MRLLIDSNGLQAWHHLGDRHRLSVFITELSLHQFSIEFSSIKSVNNDTLSDFNVLIITTRPHQKAPFSSDEISAIYDFVCSGGGLLLMSNHGPYLVEEDASLAKCFDIDIENTWFSNKLPSSPTILSGDLLNNSHPIITGGSIRNRINSIVTNTSCSIYSEASEPLALLSHEMVDKLKNNSQPSNMQLFGVALDQTKLKSSTGQGKVVVLADSGFIGSDTTLYPGPGLICKGDNIRFMLNTINWLCGSL